MLTIRVASSLMSLFVLCAACSKNEGDGGKRQAVKDVGEPGFADQLGPIGDRGQEDHPAAEELARDMMQPLLTGHYDQARAHFDATMREKLSVDQLRQVMQGVGQLAGEVEGIVAIAVEDKDDYQVASVTVAAQKTNLLFTVSIKEGKVAGLFVKPAPKTGAGAPAYVNPSAFREEKVELGEEGWKLGGSISVPESCPAPGVVLVHGSGPSDRDETVLSRKPFRDLAQGLASRGIAVLRYDKRSMVHGEKLAENPGATVMEETIEDAVHAARLLGEHPCTDAERIFVLGHSLGGYLAPRIARHAADREVGLAGLILAAGSNRSLADLVVEQTRYLLSLKGETLTDDDREALAEIEKQADVTRAVRDAGDADGPLLLGLTPAYVADLNAYDPLAAIRTVKLPMLILQGEADYQVTMVDFERWKKALRGRKDVRFESYSKVDHLLGLGERDKSRPEDYAEPRPVHQPVVEDIAAFVKKRG